jgi:hypothetical protein
MLTTIGLLLAGFLVGFLTACYLVGRRIEQARLR